MAKDKYFYLKLNEMADQQVTVSMSDAVSLDEDTLMPTGVSPSHESNAEVWSVFVTRDELAAAGLVAADVPNLTVIDITEGE